MQTILDLAEQKVQYLGLQSYRMRNFSNDGEVSMSFQPHVTNMLHAELKKLGLDVQGMLYVQLSNFPSHYLVLVIADQDFRYALINTSEVENSMTHNLTMDSIDWLDVRRIHRDVSIQSSAGPEPVVGQKRKRDGQSQGTQSPEEQQYPMSFRLETNVLRELYAYCW